VKSQLGDLGGGERRLREICQKYGDKKEAKGGDKILLDEAADTKKGVLRSRKGENFSPGTEGKIPVKVLKIKEIGKMGRLLLKKGIGGFRG